MSIKSAFLWEKTARKKALTRKKSLQIVRKSPRILKARYIKTVTGHRKDWLRMVKKTRKEVTAESDTKAVADTKAVDLKESDTKAVADRKANLVKKYVKALPAPSVYDYGVREYAIDLAKSLIELVQSDGDFPANTVQLRRKLLNGARGWYEYSYGGCSLIWDGDIAMRFNRGLKDRIPNGKKSWMDAQAAALDSAFNKYIKPAYYLALKKAESDSRFHYTISIDGNDYTAICEARFGKTADKFTDEDCLKIAEREWRSYVKDVAQSVKVEVIREDEELNTVETVAYGEYVRYLLIEEIENEEINDFTDVAETDGVNVAKMTNADCRKLAEKEIEDSIRKFGDGRLRFYVICGKDWKESRIPYDWQLSASSGWIDFGGKEGE